MDAAKAEVWNRWTKEQEFDAGIPLFETQEDLTVETTRFGRGEHEREVFKRSQPMEELVRRETGKVREDFRQQIGEYEGVIYVMYWEERMTR